MKKLWKDDCGSSFVLFLVVIEYQVDRAFFLINMDCLEEKDELLRKMWL